MPSKLNPLLVFPVEIKDLIFQHVTGAEILKISEVSPDFYNFFADSEKFMKKIILKLAKNEFSDENKLILIESGRKYQNIYVSQFEGALKLGKEIIENSAGNFTNIEIKCIDFETVADAIGFFTVIEPSIEELRMDQVYIKSIVRPHDYETCNLKFPKLKVLETKCCQALLYHEVFLNCTTLETFIIKSGSYISTTAHEAIKTILKSNSRIKILGIHFNVFNLIFNEDVTEFTRFKLKEFHANDLYRVPRFFSDVKENIHSFILAQIETFETLTVGDWLGMEAFKAIFHIPKLKSLTMKGFHHTERFLDFDDCELHKNPVIESLNLNDMSNNFKILQKVVDATPNLKNLKIYLMDQRAMEFLSSNCKNLKSLHVEHFQPSDISNGRLFENLQEFSCRKIDDCLRIEVKVPLTHFEKLIFK